MFSNEYYLDHSFEELVESGKDILAQTILSGSEPIATALKGILPKVEKGKYYFLSGAASWHGLILYPDGSVVPQEQGEIKNPFPIFSPLEEDSELGMIMPMQSLLDGWIPIVTSAHRKNDKGLTITYFVEYGDTDSNPQLWIQVANGSDRKAKCYVVSHSRPYRKRQISCEEFEEVRKVTEDEWRRLGEEFDIFSLPDVQLERSFKAMMCNLFSTFSGDHAHYGHLFYGREIHDNFPPNYLCAVETCHVLGMTRRAWRMLEHLLTYGIDAAGRFYYRQGLLDIYGASGAEYGKLLCKRQIRMCSEIFRVFL